MNYRNSPVSKEFIDLDLSALNPGNSRLTVTVKDLNIGALVENNIEFALRE